jgi:hypothetical protein
LRVILDVYSPRSIASLIVQLIGHHVYIHDRAGADYNIGFEPALPPPEGQQAEVPWPR